MTALSHGNNSVSIKLALACVTCDIPVTRKVHGFLNHNVAFGCNKCLKQFNVSFGERTDYSGFNRENCEFYVLCSRIHQASGKL